jgi:hypothetical protein
MVVAKERAVKCLLHLKAINRGYPMSHMVFYVAGHGFHNPRVMGYPGSFCAKLDNPGLGPIER